jgi:tRNA threonylcarbamoyladenosine biosynthesis protein TsaE
VEQTLSLARKLAPSFTDSDVVVLEGRLGAGKTVFVRGLAKARELKEASVSSPSFGMVHEHPGKQPLYHFDLYRMSDPDELREIGWDDYLERPGLVVVEWGEKAKDCLPETYYLIQFTIVSEKEREIEISLVQQ